VKSGEIAKLIIDDEKEGSVFSNYDDNMASENDAVKSTERQGESALIDCAPLSDENQRSVAPGNYYMMEERYKKKTSHRQHHSKVIVSLFITSDDFCCQ